MQVFCSKYFAANLINRAGATLLHPWFYLVITNRVGAIAPVSRKWLYRGASPHPVYKIIVDES